MGISVSRVGGNAQTKPMKKVAGKLRLELSQYRELEAFAQFGSELDAETQATLARGERLVETLNQDELKPWKVEDQVAAIYSGTGGYLDRIKTERIQRVPRADAPAAALREGGAAEEDRRRRLGRLDRGASSARRSPRRIDDFGPDFDEEGNPLEEGESDRIKDEEERSRPHGRREHGDDGEEPRRQAATRGGRVPYPA